MTVVFESGRRDSNSRPPAPKARETQATPADTVPETACFRALIGRLLDNEATRADSRTPHRLDGASA